VAIAREVPEKCHTSFECFPNEIKDLTPLCHTFHSLFILLFFKIKNKK